MRSSSAITTSEDLSALGLVYVPVEAPTGDYYGGHRPGNNLYSSGLVALDVKSGTMKWAFQTTHHDIWDWDMPSAPILADITVDGKAIKAVAVPTKQNYLYVFDRTNGTPVWPIVETPVPKGELPGEWYAPTQPIPSKPPAFGRQGVKEEDLLDFTRELNAKAKEFVKGWRMGSMWEPPSELDPANGKMGTLQLPGSTGGPNWQGGSIDPESNIVYIYSKDEATALSMVRGAKRSNMDWINGAGGEGGRRLAIDNLPIIRPPWGQISAIDLNKGTILWQAVHGETEDAVKNHPAEAGLYAANMPVEVGGCGSRYPDLAALRKGTGQGQFRPALDLRLTPHEHPSRLRGRSTRQIPLPLHPRREA